MVFWTIASLFLGSVTLDVGSTLYVYPRCQPCVETNPIARLVIDKPPLLIAGAAGASLGVVFISKRLENKNFKLWFVLPVALTVRHLFAAKNNFNLLEVEKP